MLAESMSTCQTVASRLCVLTNDAPTSIHLGIVWLTNEQRAQEEPPAAKRQKASSDDEPWASLDGEFDVARWCLADHTCMSAYYIYIYIYM